eukprot:s105_g17.t1
MAFQLTYRLTFIDTVEAPPIGALPHSRSLPVLGSSPTADEEVHYQAYVSQLSQQMAERDLTFVAQQTKVTEAEKEATKSDSIGHQWGLCRRPCIYHLACGTCTKGADCGFCHMSHGERVPKLDKQQRTVLQELGAGELWRLLPWSLESARTDDRPWWPLLAVEADRLQKFKATFPPSPLRSARALGFSNSSDMEDEE